MDPITLLPQAVELIQKAGVLGLLVIVCAVLGYEVTRLRKQSTVLYKERDAYRNRYILYKAECDRARLTVDTSSLSPLPELQLLT